MNKREKIEDKFEKMMDDIDYKQYHIICNYIDLTVGEALVNQKQTILKAIMEKSLKTKELHDNCSCNQCMYVRFRNRNLEEFESVIKEVLGEQKKVKGKFMPYNPNNY